MKEKWKKNLVINLDACIKTLSRDKKGSNLELQGW